MKNYRNEERKLGVELEFHGLRPLRSAEIVSQVVGGVIHKKTEDLVEVLSSDGTYRLETDAAFIKRLSSSSKERQSQGKADYDGFLKKVISPISEEFVPTELVTPPLSVNKLPRVTRIHQKLKENGAQGSIESARFAFAAQLNPEVLSLQCRSILRHLQAFLVISKWLKNQIQMDTTRFLTTFASDFPKRYQLKVLHQNYQPDMDAFIDDYLADNPTRNRSLDLLPLLAFLDETRVKSLTKHQKLNPRPTFHYRLPNCQISLDSWTIEVEWKRWLMVERLAACDEIFKRMKKKYLDNLNEPLGFPDTHWLIDSNNYLERLRP